MTLNIDDVHSFNSGFIRAMERLKESDISQENKDIIEKFIVKCQLEGLAKSTLVGYLNYITRMTQRLKEIGITKSLDTLTEDEFNLLLVTLQNEKGLKQSGLRNYKKVTKKFFNVITLGEPPNWVRKLQLTKKNGYNYTILLLSYPFITGSIFNFRDYVYSKET